MNERFDHLSIWEISHRWHQLDPNLSNPQKLQLDVQDTIRLICIALVNCELSVNNKQGIQIKNPLDCPGYNNYSPQSEWRERTEIDPPILPNDPPLDFGYENQIEIQPGDLTQDELWNQYMQFKNNWDCRHWELVDGLECTYTERSYDKTQLEAAHLSRSEIIRLCQLNKLCLPDFWFTESEFTCFKNDPNWKLVYKTEKDDKGSQAIELDNIRITQEVIDKFWSKLSHKQKVRILSREVASVLWKIDPNRSIKSISEDNNFLIYGQADHYAGKNTRRDWIKDLDPRKPEDRIGRPSKTK